MKQISIKLILLLMAVPFTGNYSANAQKREKGERIIIQKKGDKQEKMVIEIDGDKIKVNGKEVKDGDGNIIIREMDKDGLLGAPHHFEFNFPQKAFREFQNHQGQWERFGRDWQNRSRDWQQKMRKVHEKMKEQAFLGVGTDEVEKGLKITEVQKESAAEKASLEEGDIITKVDGEDMKEAEQLISAVRKHKAGDEITIEYLRDGKKKSTKAVLKSITENDDDAFNFEGIEMPSFNFERLPDLPLMQPWGDFKFNDNSFPFRKGPKLGVTVQDTEDEKGVTVEEVDADSPAAKSGIQKGDIITEINGKKITNVKEAREAMNSNEDKNKWSFQVQRGGKPLVIEIKIPKELRKTELKP